MSCPSSVRARRETMAFARRCQRQEAERLRRADVRVQRARHQAADLIARQEWGAMSCPVAELALVPDHLREQAADEMNLG